MVRCSWLGWWIGCTASECGATVRARGRPRPHAARKRCETLLRRSRASEWDSRVGKRRLATVYKAEQFEVRPAERRLFAHGQPVSLGGRAFDLLLVLIE